MENVLLATCAMQLSEGTPTAPDDIALLGALERRGIRARAVAWNDPGVEWAAASLIIIRSTWDYYLHYNEFLAWVEQVAALRPLYPPVDVIRWNAHKSYLRELAHRGIPIVPTHWIERGTTADLATIMVQQGWPHVVLKPAVGGNAYGVFEVDRQRIHNGQTYLDHLLKERDVLVQPFLSASLRLGEHSLFWIAGHWNPLGVCKRTATRSTATTSGDERILPASSDEMQLAQHILDCAAEILTLPYEGVLFARIDLVPQEDGQLRLMELEMLEARLYFDFFPHLAERLADALIQNLEPITRQEPGLQKSSQIALPQRVPALSLYHWRTSTASDIVCHLVGGSLTPMIQSGE